MKPFFYISVAFLVLSLTVSASQKDSTEAAGSGYPVSKVTVEPAIGLNPMPSSDVLITNLIQWNIKKRLSIVSHTLYSVNNAFQRNNNYVRTNYNYSLSQKFGIGTSLYLKNSSHTLSILAGIKYDSFKETLENPEFEKFSASLSTSGPDVGLMYGLKIGKKKYFFSYRMYIPLYPYPLKTTDTNSIDGNMANLSMEFGFGIRLK
jgi:hypothetical protein